MLLSQSRKYECAERQSNHSHKQESQKVTPRAYPDFRLQFQPATDDNRTVPSTSFYQDPQVVSPFRQGALVIATLTNPREKFWGAILHLSGEGLSLRGVDVSSFDDLASQIKNGEPFTSGVVFFPMHRVERMELDLPEGNILSLAQRFAEKTGQDPAPLLVSEFLGHPGGHAAGERPR